MKRGLALFLCLFMVVALIVGCTPTQDPISVDPAKPVDPPEDTPKYGGTVKLSMFSAPPGLFNPVFYIDVYDGHIVDMVFDPLVTTDGEMKMTQARVAKSWSFNEDGTKVTFKLRDDVTFHDGKPLTARDVKFTYDVIAHPDYSGTRTPAVASLKGFAAARAGETEGIEGVKIINDYEISFEVEKFDVKLLLNRGYGILPYHLLGNVPVADMPHHSFNDHPIGSGPYKFVNLVQDSHVVLEANEDYYLGRPYIDEVVWVVRNQEVSLMELEAGELDICNLTPQHPELIADWSHVSLINELQLTYQYMGFNMQDPRFDKNVRQAFMYGIDRQTMVDNILLGYGTVLNVPIAPMHWAYNDQVNTYPYNPTKAKELLAASGWVLGSDGILVKDGEQFVVELMFPTGNQVRMESAPIIRQYLGELGVKVELNTVDFATLLQRTFARPQPYQADQFDMVLLGWQLDVDPDQTSTFHTKSWGGNNYVGYGNPEIDALLDRGLSLITAEERTPIYHEMQRILNDEVAYVFLYAPNGLYGINNRIQGLELDHRNPWHNIHEWWILE